MYLCGGEGRSRSTSKRECEEVSERNKVEARDKSERSKSIEAEGRGRNGKGEEERKVGTSRDKWGGSSIGKRRTERATITDGNKSGKAREGIWEVVSDSGICSIEPRE